MKRNRKKYRFHFKPTYALIILLIIAAISVVSSLQHPDHVGIIPKSLSSLIIPIQKGLTRIGFDFQSGEQATMEQLKTENEFLKDQMDDLEEKIFNYEKQQTELKRLRELYQLDKEFEVYNMTAARVIGKGESNWFSTFLINKGSNDGLKKNMNVVSKDGLIGFLSDVYPTYSKVTTIIDESSGVSAEFLKSEVLCMVHGDMQQIQTGTLPVINIDSEAEVKKGDVIVTSSISSKYLPGLRIGIAGDVTMDESSLSKISIVTPSVNFKNIHEVLIITTLKEEYQFGE